MYLYNDCLLLFNIYNKNCFIKKIYLTNISNKKRLYIYIEITSIKYK